MLAKPESTTCEIKRKADEPPAEEANTEFSFAGLKKKPKEEWICDVCQIHVSSCRQLDEHRQGKKHKAKEARSRAGRTGKTERTASSSELNLDDASSGLKEQVDPEKHQASIDGLGKIREGEEVSERNASSIELNLGNAASGAKELVQADKGLIDGLGERAVDKEVTEKVKELVCDESIECVAATTTTPNVLLLNVTDAKENAVDTNDAMPVQKSEVPVISNTVAATEQIEETNPKSTTAKKFKSWCEMCHLGSDSEGWMELHQKGRIHVCRLLELTAKPSTHACEKVEESATDKITEHGCAGSDTDSALKTKIEAETCQVSTSGLVKATSNKDRIENNNNEMAAESSNNVQAKGEQTTVTTPVFTAKSKYKFWCEVCQTGTNSGASMQDHLKGKKHLTRLRRKQAQNGTAGCRDLHNHTAIDC